jgi:hypothetical protein
MRVKGGGVGESNGRYKVGEEETNNGRRGHVVGRVYGMEEPSVIMVVKEDTNWM